MVQQTPIDIARRWLDAFNRHDLEALLELYHDDAEHFSPKLKQRMPETNGMIRGKEALRKWWSDAFQRLPGLTYRAKFLTADSERVFMEYAREVPGEEIFSVAEVLQVKDGLIRASRVYHG
jgi:ketosteroid isomerase-like protein